MQSSSSSSSTTSGRESRGVFEERVKARMQKLMDEGLDRNHAFAEAIKEINRGSDKPTEDGNNKSSQSSTEIVEEVESTNQSMSTASTSRFGHSSTFGSTDSQILGGITSMIDTNSTAIDSGSMQIDSERRNSIVIHEDGQENVILSSPLNKKSTEKNEKPIEENAKEDDDMVEITNGKQKEGIQETSSMHTTSSNDHNENLMSIDIENEEQKKKEKEELERLQREEIASIQQKINNVIKEYEDELKNMKKDCLEPDQRIILHRQALKDTYPEKNSSASCILESYDELLQKVTLKDIITLVNIQNDVLLIADNKELKREEKQRKLSPLFDQFYSLLDDILQCFENTEILAQSFTDENMWQAFGQLEEKRKKRKGVYIYR